MHSVLHACLQLVVFIFELRNLLHDIIKVLLEVSRRFLLGFECVLGLLFFQIERFRGFQWITEAVS